MERRPGGFIIALVLLLAGTLTPLSPAVAAEELCFPETGQCISGRFREFWEQNGGLPVFGYPISPARSEVNPDTGERYLTQWFERNRFELHPANDRPYDVLLGRLGNDRLLQQDRRWQDFPKADPAAKHYFPETGHAIAEVFWNYWRTHGLEFDERRGTSFQESLALFGMPLSEPETETNSSGDTVLTQWFERARFEYHPDNPAAYKVLLGLLGNEVSNANPCPNVPAPVSARLHTSSCIDPGTIVVFDIYGFQPNEQVSFWLVDPAGATMVGTESSLTVGPSGDKRNLSFYTDGMYKGHWRWVFQGVAGRHQAVIHFFIRE